MKRKQKQLIYVLAGVVGIGIVSLSGCIVSKPPTPTQIADEINIDVFTAVDSYIALGRTTDQQKLRAQEINATALKLQSIAESPVDISDLRQIALTIVTSTLDKEQQIIVRFAVNLIINHVRRSLGIDSVTVIPADKLPITRQFLKAAATGAIEASQQYLQ